LLKSGLHVRQACAQTFDPLTQRTQGFTPLGSLRLAPNHLHGCTSHGLLDSLQPQSRYSALWIHSLRHLCPDIIEICTTVRASGVHSRLLGRRLFLLLRLAPQLGLALLFGLAFVLGDPLTRNILDQAVAEQPPGCVLLRCLQLLDLPIKVVAGKQDQPPCLLGIGGAAGSSASS